MRFHLSWTNRNAYFLNIIIPFCASNVNALAIDSFTVNETKGRWNETEFPDLFKPEDKNIQSDEFKPILYEIFFDVSQGMEIFSGQVNISLIVLKTTNRLKVHANSLNITQVNVLRQDSGEKIGIKKLWYQESRQIFTIQTNTNIPANTLININFKYSGVFQRNSGANTMSILLNKVYRNSSRYVYMTKFEPIGARKAFPCFDLPNMKAKFRVTIRHATSLTAYSNMPVEKIRFLGNSTISIFKESPVMSSYLVFFAICDCQRSIEYTKSNLEVGMIYFKEYGKSFSTVLKQVIRIVEYFEQYLNISYPLPKLDLFTVPDYPTSGMEHYGLIVQRSGKTFVAMDQRVEIEDVIYSLLLTSHEVAHQWFGDMVSIKCWEELWMKEGFASFYGIKASSILEPGLNADQYSLNEEYREGLLADVTGRYGLLNATIPKVMNLSDVSGSFDWNMIYRKGAYILQMLEGFIGDKKMAQAVRSYVRKYANSSALTSQFAEEVQSFYDKVNVTKFLDSWTRQSGVSIVSVNQSKQGHIRLIQRSSLFVNCHSIAGNTSPASSRVCIPSEENTLWMIPLKYRTSDGFQGMIWLTEREKEIFVPGNFSWILFNQDNKGYFVVEYTKEAWYRFIEDLKFPEKFTVDEHLRLLFDSHLLAESHRIDIAIFRDVRAAVKHHFNSKHGDNKILKGIPDQIGEKYS